MKTLHKWYQDHHQAIWVSVMFVAIWGGVPITLKLISSLVF